MHKLLLIFLLLPVIAYSQSKQQKEVLAGLDKSYDNYVRIAQEIWDLAEVGYQEEKSSGLLQQELRSQGFTIEGDVAGMPTAFVASYGSGKPIIGILAEYDALPGVSQAAVPERQEIPGKNAGHACGHHLFGTASSAAGIAIKDWLKRTGKSGTIRVYGTPAEEGGAGKVYMVREGLFDDVDVVLHWHPSSSNSASASSSLANKSAKFRFYGQAAHASSAPHRGRSALDGVEAMNVMVNMLREHIPMESRIHYVITSGGEAPNVVPGFAEVYYYVRHPESAVVRETFDKVVDAAEGAAKGTQTRMEYEVIHGIYELLPNKSISEIMHKNLEIVGGVKYNEEEAMFAQKIIDTFDGETDKDLIKTSEVIRPFTVTTRGTGGSTDVGDVSWVVPTADVITATYVPGTAGHSWQAVAAGGTSIGHKGMMVAAKTMALTAIEIMNDPEVIKAAWKELNERRGSGFKYQSLLGDRKPPLDYRK